MNRKTADKKIARLNRIVDFLQQQKQSLATGDGDVRMLAAAVVYWEHWPSYLEGAVSLVVDAFGHDSDSQAKDWLWRVRSAYFDVMCESVHLIARESERENLDTTALWRGWHCIRPLLGDSSVELPILLRKENLPTSRVYVLEANAVIERLGTRVDLREPVAVAVSQAEPLEGQVLKASPNVILESAEVSIIRQLAAFYPKQVGLQDFEEHRDTAKRWLKSLQQKGMAECRSVRNGWVITESGRSTAELLKIART